MDDHIVWSPSQPRVQLQKDEVHVWRAVLDVSPELLGMLSCSLGGDEANRADQFLFAGDRNHFVAAHGITRNILSGYMQTSPETLCFSVGPNGKPVLSRKTDSLDLRFNLSHSHGLAMLAVALGREVGIDVERIRPGIADEGIQAHIFTAHEQAEFQHTVLAERDREFLRRWTCKEAFVKALGDGLQIPLNSFEVSFATCTSPVLRGPGCEPWNLFSFSSGDEYVAALVVEGKTKRLKFWDWALRII